MSENAWAIFFEALKPYINWAALGHQLFDGTNKPWTRETVIDTLMRDAEEMTK